MSYGKELILDLHNCDASKFNRRYIRRYFIELCDLIDMERCKLAWWDYFWTPWFWRSKDPKTYGISAVQFIMTSNVTVHTLPLLHTIYINVFSCKDFDQASVEYFTSNWFSGQVVQSLVVERL